MAKHATESVLNKDETTRTSEFACFFSGSSAVLNTDAVHLQHVQFTAPSRGDHGASRSNPSQVLDGEVQRDRLLIPSRKASRGTLLHPIQSCLGKPMTNRSGSDSSLCESESATVLSSPLSVLDSAQLRPSHLPHINVVEIERAAILGFPGRHSRRFTSLKSAPDRRHRPLERRSIIDRTVAAFPEIPRYSLIR